MGSFPHLLLGNLHCRCGDAGDGNKRLNFRKYKEGLAHAGPSLYLLPTSFPSLTARIALEVIVRQIPFLVDIGTTAHRTLPVSYISHNSFTFFLQLFWPTALVVFFDK